MADELPKTSDSPRPFRWTTATEEAAQLVAADKLTDAEIAAKAGVTPRTLFSWKNHPDFSARVESHVETWRQRVRKRGIAQIEYRVDALQHRHDLLNRVVAERAADPKMQDVPGGGTGLMVHNVKSVGSGPTAERVDLYEVDTGLLSELRAVEKQAAQELGQWAERQEVATTGETVVKVLKGVSMDDL